MIKLHIGHWIQVPKYKVYQIQFENGDKTVAGTSLIDIVHAYYINAKVYLRYVTLSIQETREYNSIEELKEDFAEEFI